MHTSLSRGSLHCESLRQTSRGDSPSFLITVMPLFLKHGLPLWLTTRMHYNWIYSIDELDGEMWFVVHLHLLSLWKWHSFVFIIVFFLRLKRLNLVPYSKSIVIFKSVWQDENNMNCYFYKDPKEVLILVMSSVFILGIMQKSIWSHRFITWGTIWWFLKGWCLMYLCTSA